MEPHVLDRVRDVLDNKTVEERYAPELVAATQCPAANKVQHLPQHHPGLIFYAIAGGLSWCGASSCDWSWASMHLVRELPPRTRSATATYEHTRRLHELLVGWLVAGGEGCTTTTTRSSARPATGTSGGRSTPPGRSSAPWARSASRRTSAAAAVRRPVPHRPLARRRREAPIELLEADASGAAIAESAA